MVKIDLADHMTHGARILTGRDRGKVVREAVGLDALDVGEDQVEVFVPLDTYAITSSFFLSMFGPSIRRCGDFHTRYTFKGKDFTHQIAVWVGKARQRGGDNGC